MTGRAAPMYLRRHLARWLWSGVFVAGAAAPALAQPSTAELKRMSLQDLLDVEVSTVSRQPERSSSVPAAVHVITQDDIRRSGATSIPEALRLAPGVQVARIDGSRWSIGMRGFADRLARSMLVLMDGRAVYNPLFAGTYWEVQDLLLEDVDRIEVIRGPGGTLWGANAVNGIINIITKRAADTQGLLVTSEAGTYGRGLVGLRYGGGTADGRLNYRAYAKAFQRGHQFRPAGSYDDQTQMVQGGGRADWTPSNRDTLTVQGDVYGMDLGQQQVLTSYAPPYRLASAVETRLSGGNVLARFGRVGPTSGFQVQAFYDRTHRPEQPIGERRQTFDLDLQRRQRVARHQLTFGAGYRVTSGRITAAATSFMTPPVRTDNLFTAFVHDDIPLAGERVRVSVGTKLEHNAYSAFEIQPSARVLWTVREGHTVFGAVTRAVRTPSRVETDYSTTSLASPNGPVFVRLLPNPQFTPEEVLAYEAGYRVRPMSRAYLTLSTFYNRLDNTVSTEGLPARVESGPAGPRIVIPVTFANGIRGESAGGEVTADVRPFAWFRTTAHYSYLRIAVRKKPGSADVSQERRYEGLSPRHQLQVQASLDLPRGWTADWLVRRVSALPAGPVPAYTTSTIRAAWQLTPRLEVAVVGQDLHRARHLEWAGSGVLIQRTAYVKLTVR